MKDNAKFITLLEELIKEMITSKSPLLESPVQTRGEVLVENRVKTILRPKAEK
tara:strand:- start:1295 stop:1453 length:159 start_codon:yes stop_codon:yes gene_type:complete